MMIYCQKLYFVLILCQMIWRLRLLTHTSANRRPLEIGLCILHHLTRSFLILAVWFRRDAKMQIFFFPSKMASSEEAALIYIVLWCITWIFQMLFLDNKCFHTLQFDIETVDKRGISTTYIQGRQMQISKVSFSNEPGLEHLLLGASCQHHTGY